jgi:hypothetical protein
LFFPKQRNYDLTKPSRPHEGPFAIVTIRGAGCDGRGTPGRGTRASKIAILRELLAEEQIIKI